jgi:hypothetical protein
MPRLKTTPLEFCPNFSKSCINCAPNNSDEARWSCLMVDRLLSHKHYHYVNHVYIILYIIYIYTVYCVYMNISKRTWLQSCQCVWLPEGV